MPVLKQGSSGPDVQDLQPKLKDLGFDPNSVRGNFGFTFDLDTLFSKFKPF